MILFDSLGAWFALHQIIVANRIRIFCRHMLIKKKREKKGQKRSKQSTKAGH